jgi:prefoldin subunit 5
MFSVSANIKAIESHIQQLQQQMGAIQTELIRLDGSLAVFRQMSNLGLEDVPLPKDEVLESLN